jgi:hypothetical protein
MFSKNSDLPAKNKGGRPRGSKSPKTKSERLFDRLMNSRGAKLERILDTVMAQAEQGDNACVRAIFDRVFPARGRTVKLSLRSIRSLRQWTPAPWAPAEAKDVLDVLRAKIEMANMVEFDKRLAALERGEGDANSSSAQPCRQRPGVPYRSRNSCTAPGCCAIHRSRIAAASRSSLILERKPQSIRVRSASLGTDALSSGTSSNEGFCGSCTRHHLPILSSLTVSQYGIAVSR